MNAHKLAEALRRLYTRYRVIDPRGFSRYRVIGPRGFCLIEHCDIAGHDHRLRSEALAVAAACEEEGDTEKTVEQHHFLLSDFETRIEALEATMRVVQPSAENANDRIAALEAKHNAILNLWTTESQRVDRLENAAPPPAPEERKMCWDPHCDKKHQERTPHPRETCRALDPPCVSCAPPEQAHDKCRWCEKDERDDHEHGDHVYMPMSLVVSGEGVSPCQRCGTQFRDRFSDCVPLQRHSFYIPFPDAPTRAEGE